MPGLANPGIIVGRKAEWADFGGFLLFAGLLVAERVVMLAHALGLFGREVVHADVVDVVHEVGDRIVARERRANAAVALHAEELGFRLGRRVLDLVARRGA